MGNKLPTQKTYTEAIDKDGNRYIGQTTNNRIADNFANIGSDIANSGIEGFNRGASSVPSQSYYEAIWDIFFALLKAFYKFNVWVWKQSKLAGLILISIEVIFLAFVFFGRTISAKIENFGSSLSSIAQFPSTQFETHKTSPDNTPIPIAAASNTSTAKPQRTENVIVFGSKFESENAWNDHVLELEDIAQEKYTDQDRSIPGRTLVYTINLDNSQPILLTNRWCATNSRILESNKTSIEFISIVSGKTISEDQMGYATYDNGAGWVCHARFILIKSWSHGTTQLITKKIIQRKIDDGQTEYPAGILERDFFVTLP